MRSLARYSFIFLLVGHSLNALAKPARKPASAVTENITATVHFGDRTTEFKLKGGPQPTIESKNNNGLHKNTPLSKNNFEVLVKRFNKLGVAKVPADCARARMEITYTDAKGKSQSKQSCFAVKAGFAEDYQRYANLLVDVM